MRDRYDIITRSGLRGYEDPLNIRLLGSAVNTRELMLACSDNIPKHIDSQFGIPIIESIDLTDEITQDTFYMGLPFVKKVPRGNRHNCILHSFFDDCRIEGVWHHTERYIPTFLQFKAVLGIDYSTFSDYPQIVQLWNIYRSRLLCQFFQSNNVKMIPVIQWSQDNLINNISFSTVPQHGTVAIHSLGCFETTTYERYSYINGLKDMLSIIKPRSVIHYGSRKDVCDYITNVCSKYDCTVFNYINKSRNSDFVW